MDSEWSSFFPLLKKPPSKWPREIYFEQKPNINERNTPFSPVALASFVRSFESGLDSLLTKNRLINDL